MSENNSKNPAPTASPPAPQVEPLDRYSVLIVRGAIVGTGLLGLALFVRNSRMFEFATYRNVKQIPADFYELGIQMKGIVREVAPNGLLRVEHQPAVRLPRMLLAFQMQPKTPVFSCRYLHTSPNMSQQMVSEEFFFQMTKEKDEFLEKLREKMTEKLMEESEKVGRLRSDLVHKTEELVRTAGLLNARELIDLFDGICCDRFKENPKLSQEDRPFLKTLERNNMAKRISIYYKHNVVGFKDQFDQFYDKGMVADLRLLQAMLGTLYKMRNLEAHPSVTADRDIEIMLPESEFSTSERILVKAMLESMFESIKRRNLRRNDQR